MSTTFTTSSTFTITNARYLSSKVAADMHLCAIYYGQPGEVAIRTYSEELANLLREGYVAAYEFGYKRNGQRIVCWHYTVHADGSVSADDSPGKVVSFVDVSGAVFYNFLSYSRKWFDLNESERDRIKRSLPIQRSTGELPSDGAGYWVSDRSYSSNGIGFSRQTFRPYA